MGTCFRAVFGKLSCLCEELFGNVMDAKDLEGLGGVLDDDGLAHVAILVIVSDHFGQGRFLRFLLG